MACQHIPDQLDTLIEHRYTRRPCWGQEKECNWADDRSASVTDKDGMEENK